MNAMLAYDAGRDLIQIHEVKTPEEAHTLLPERLACVYNMYSNAASLETLHKELKQHKGDYSKLSASSAAVIDKLHDSAVDPQMIPKMVEFTRDFYDGSEEIGTQLSIQYFTHMPITSKAVISDVLAAHGLMFWGTATDHEDDVAAAEFGALFQCICSDADKGSSLAPSSNRSSLAPGSNVGTPRPLSWRSGTATPTGPAPKKLKSGGSPAASDATSDA
ncbi:hypothetical protein BD324DRAFT_618117 [Kockovaella imperatae]|uniref:Uncharacterized protein n=1 Tax=Kockovaella imperatae TaxID=4999 RepID=A0A1Y1UPC3_9TREE|nr:hypothetical protein BD324DRAFT_618117 [Kockovaella imperatae]ORX38985.1 hypothetical protein BD324DRAFT_618117 [Kockovaella imperatae]